jgi:hypothetical protein
MAWTITFPSHLPNSTNTDKMPIIEGMFIVSGFGPPGRIRRLSARLTNPTIPTLRITGHPVYSKEHPVHGGGGGKEHRWVMLFDIGDQAIPASRDYVDELLFAMPNDQAPKPVEVKLTGLWLDPAAAQPLEDCRTLRTKAPNIIYPANTATFSPTGVSSYGMATLAGETVPTNGGDVDGTPSAGGGTQPNGFWWVTFGQIPVGNHTLTVTSNYDSDTRRIIVQ